MPVPARPDLLRRLLRDHVVVSDGAMGTMLQAEHLTLEDFDGFDGCNEILNVTRPEVVRSIHDRYLDAGTDCVGTNTFGANLANLGEYDIADRIYELAKAGAAVARESADAHSTADRPRFVLGSVGPGTKLPTLLHVRFDQLRDAYEEETRGLLDGGCDAVLVETAQDLLQAKAAVIGARRAIADLHADVPVFVNVTVETTGTMLLGSEIGAALTALEALGIDMIGLNCATGPAEMSEHLRYLSRHATVAVGCMPNAGLPQLTSDGAYYPLTPEALADAHDTFTADFGLSLVGGCCGTTPEHLRHVVERVRGRPLAPRQLDPEPGLSSLYQQVPFRQDISYLAIGERTNANGSKAFRDAMVAEKWEDCVEIARNQIRDGSHALDLCVDYVGRDGVADMVELASRLATSSTLPIVLDSTEPAVLEAGLQLLGGRCALNSVNFEDGDGPGSRFDRIASLAAEYGAALVALTIDEEGQARTAEHKLAVAERLLDTLEQRYGIPGHDVMIDCLTFTLATGQEESRRDGIETLEAIRELKRRRPDVQTVLGLSNISFGLSPAARHVVNSVFLHECIEAGLDAAIVHASRIMPMTKIPDEQRGVALDLVFDRRREDYDPLQELLRVFAGVTTTDTKESRAAELAALPLPERLQRRIIDGERNGLEDDLATALGDRAALEIINTDLLQGMKVVGELFGSGEMQLPFVLQSAEVMKNAVGYLEPHMDKTDDQGKGTIVLATVKGDVHDIGKNLVDIILSNNGYTVVNLGIKQPVNAILEAADEHAADAIGMSGLLVKSTVIMKENLEELNQRGIADRWPVILGGAALTRAYVEQDLAALFDGEVRYARDAFEGLRLMDAVMAVKRGVPGAALPAPRQRRVRGSTAKASAMPVAVPERSDVSTTNPVPTPPFLGDRVVKGVPLAEIAAYLDERATFMGQWGLKSSRSGAQSYEDLVETEGHPRLRAWMDRIYTEQIMEPAVVYGYWPCYSERDDVVVLDPDTRLTEIARFTFPRQQRDRFLCLADYFRPKDSGELDVIGFHLVTMGARVSEVTAELFAKNAYRDYLELHGLSVQLTEAMAEYWHARVRAELGIDDGDAPELAGILRQGYTGERYSFGYPACPDLEDRVKIVRLLRPERIGVELSEELQLHPEQSTDALILHHPQATYFNAR
jgi:5-methyltetrahydrofolate--homocysteine methyltransferase